MRARFVWDEMEGSKGFLKDNGQPWRSWAGSGWLPSCHCPESCEHVSWRNVSTCMVANCDAIRLLVGIFYQSMSFLFCRFGYPHYLHTKFYKNVQCVWGDVMCRYWLRLLDWQTHHACLSCMPRHTLGTVRYCHAIIAANIYGWIHLFIERVCMSCSWYGGDVGKRDQQLVLGRIWSSCLATYLDLTLQPRTWMQLVRLQQHCMY